MTDSEVCVIIGASHAGVNCAFALRKEGWEGQIILLDSDPNLPYHRPPLSKAYLSAEGVFDLAVLKSKESYKEASVDLRLGTHVVKLDAGNKLLHLHNSAEIAYDKLVLAVGAKAFLPAIKGASLVKNLFTLRRASDAEEIRSAFQALDQKRVVVIGGGYIGLETAASLSKVGAKVTVLERESRVLARVTAPQMSKYFSDLHCSNSVEIHCNQAVQAFHINGDSCEVVCNGSSVFNADMVIVGVGIRVNTELAAQADLQINNGIWVDESGRTNDQHIYAIGDCACQFHTHYERELRLESVQNAVDQAKNTAAVICGKEAKKSSIPWFWSDQFDVKLQMVGLSQGYNEVIIRYEKDKIDCLSAWYFLNEELLAVDAVNNAKAYVLGGRFIKGGIKIDKSKLSDEDIELKPANLILQ